MSNAITQYTKNAFSKRRRGLLSTTAMVAAGMMIGGQAHAVDPYADWDDINIVAGSAGVTDTGLGSTQIDQHTMRAVGEAQELHIGTLGNVRINQTSSNALFVARAIGDHDDPTQILGTLTATGQVMILDRNGVIFGADSHVDVAGVAVSTGDLSNADIMDGDGSFTFNNFGDGAIELRGTVSVADSGLAAFVSPTVINSGVINAKMGTVVLAAGEVVTLDMYGDGLVEVAVEGELGNALLETTGQINAEGGNVTMTASAAKDVVDNIINVEGVVTVASVTQQGGKIVLSGGNSGAVRVAGTVDATGTTGGDIEVTGEYVLADAGAVLDASGTNGGGTIHFGGEYQGGGETPTSDYTYVAQNAILRANADEEGDGGEVIVWADKGTGFYGNIDAKGGANAGNGGFVEVSSLGFFDFKGMVDTTAANGETGLLLLDPENVEIRGGTGDSEDNGGVGAGGNNNLGDGGNGIIAFANNYGLSSTATMTIYESEIEGQSLTTNINIQARKNITTDLGTSVDGVVSLANNRNLTIQTSNGSGDAGSINLTNLGFSVGGTGSINILGSNGGGNAGNITVKNLTAQNGNINVSTDNGFVLSTGLINVTGSGNVNLTAEDNVEVDGTGITTQGGNVSLTGGAGSSDDVFVNGNINTNGGDFSASAGDDVRIALSFPGAQINTGGGNATVAAGDEFSMGADSQINTTVFGDVEGNVNITADQVILDTASGGYRILAQDGTTTPPEGKVTIRRTTDGNVSLGDDNGGLHLSQAEVDKIFAEQLEVGGEHTSAITVSNFDTTVATILNLVTLITTNVNSGGDDDVIFNGNNTFNALSVLSDDDIVFNDGSKVETVNGGASFYGDSNAGTIGDFNMGENSLLDTNGFNVNISSLNVLMEDDARINSESGNIEITARDDFAANEGNVTLEGDAKIDAEGGNIKIDNEGVFTGGTSSVRTEGVGTIAINQNRGTAGGASIQNVINAIENTGTGQNTIFTDGSTYTENLIINENKLKIDGAGTTIAGFITVSEADFNLDPVVMDGGGVLDYGVVASGIGADGLVIDGNTFRNYNEGGIYVERTAATTGTIKNNIFEGSSTRGLVAGPLGGGYTLNITDNTIGTNGDEVLNGLLFGTVDLATINISGGSIDSTDVTGGPINGDGINFTEGLNSGADVNVSNIVINSDNDEAFDVHKEVKAGASVDIVGGTYNGGNNGVEFGDFQGPAPGISGIVRISDATITGNGTNHVGINLLSSITGQFEVTNSTITGTDHGIGMEANRTRHKVDGGIVRIIGNWITGIGGDGIELSDVTDDATVEITGNHAINGGKNGVNLRGIVDDSTVIISNNNHGIHAGDHGIKIAGNVSASGIDIHDNIIEANLNTDAVGSGIYFGGTITDSDVHIGDGALNSNPSNIISVSGNAGAGGVSDLDGIHFNKNIGTDAKILIDGNRIGFTAGPLTAAPVADDGVEFRGAVNSNADVQITDNRINAHDDGVQFNATVGGTASVFVGETPSDADGNIINAGDNGVSFLGHVEDDAVVKVLVNNITADNNGVEFNGIDGATVEVSENTIVAGGNGVEFGPGSASVSGGANVGIYHNIIQATLDGIYVDDDITGAGTSFWVGGNTITAGDDGVDIDNVRNAAQVNIGGPVAHDSASTSTNKGNIIVARSNGVEFDAGVDAIVFVRSNRISAGEDGVNVRDDDSGHTTGVDSGAYVEISGNDIGSKGSDTIGDDGIDFDDDITGNSTVLISGNKIGRSGAKVGDDGIDIDTITGGANVSIINNPQIYAADNGIEINGPVNGGANLTISGNNHGIHANDHGIVFNGHLTDNAHVNIHDNIISANEDGGSVGDGIRFEGFISDSTVNIGDGTMSPFSGGASNWIRGWDGIHFDNVIADYAKINIDGNRIGYGKQPNGSTYSDPTDDDGIQFIGDIESGSNVKITDNWIKSKDDGVSFIGKIQDNATVLIGGHDDGNKIWSGDEGIQFEGDIKDHSLLEISYNTVDAEGNGVEFNGTTSNHLHSGHGEEILIKKNSITGKYHGITFYGQAENSRHDIMIRDNYLIKGERNNGINHTGNIKDAELTIQHNDQIDGDDDGIHLSGYFYDDAAIRIHGNKDVRGRDDDGIHVEDYGFDTGVDLEIDRNHVHNSGDDGIFVKNVQDAVIHHNTVHNVGGNGIYGSNVDYADIHGNTIYDIGENGIKINPSDYVDIAYNTIHDVKWDGILVDNGVGADIWGNHVHRIGYDGIDVNNNDYVEIWKNYVKDTGDNGIEVSDSYRAKIKYNDVKYTDGDGINVYKSNKAEVNKNDVYRAKGDGIKVDKSDYVEINWNDVTKSGRDGIDLSRSKHSEIKGNEVWHSGDNGIEVTDSAHITIGGDHWWEGNKVALSRGAGVYVDPSFFINVQHNNLFWNTYGVKFDDVWFGNIQENNIHDNFIGVKLIDSHFIDVNDNYIANNFVGLWAYGGENGYIKVRNNVFLDNPIHAKFNSGIIDLTDLEEGQEYSNEFHGGKIGLYFDAWHDKPWLLSLVKTGGIANGWTYDYLWPFLTSWNFYGNDSYTFDTFDGTTVFPPSEFGGTIGAQLFDGQEDYFVKLGSKTFVVPGDSEGGDEVFAVNQLVARDIYYPQYPDSWKAIWLDAQDSTYVMDGVPFSPAAQGGVTPEQLAFLEEKFKHWPDVDNRGIFFFGPILVPDDLTELAQERIFERFDPFNGGLSGLNVTITGLPPVNLGPQALAGITPAAGGEGEEGEDLANIEPAAGGEQAGCLGDAVGLASAGTPATIDWGGTVEELLSGAAGCGSETF